MGVYDARKTEQNASDEREVDFIWFYSLPKFGICRAKLSWVRLAEDFIEYLQQKHPAIRSEDLCFEPEGGYARSIVLYMLQEDFERPTSSAPKKKAADLHAKSVNVSEMSRNHFNWKDAFAGGRELGVAQEVGVSKIPSFWERKHYHEVAYTKQFPPSKSPPIQENRVYMLRSFQCRSILAGESWCNPGLSPSETMCDIFSISLVASTMDTCGRGQHKSGLDLSELVEAWDSSGTTAGAASAKGTCISPNSVSVMTENKKDKDSWRQTWPKAIYHHSMPTFYTNFITFHSNLGHAMTC